MKYHIFDKSIHITSKLGATYVPRDSENFDLIRDMLIQGREEMVLNLLRSENRLDIKNIEEHDGRYFFREEEVPTMLCDMLASPSSSSISSMAMLNYWINKTVGRDSISPERLRLIVGNTVHPVDESGFLFLVDERSPIDGAEFFPAKLSTTSKEMLGINGLRGMCDRMLGVSSKKVISVAKKLIFRNGVVDDSFFNLVTFLSIYLKDRDVNVLIRLLESDLIKIVGRESRANIIEMADLLSRTFSPTRLINALDKEFDPTEGNREYHILSGQGFSIMADTWREISHEAKVGKTESMADLLEYLKEEKEKGSIASYPLNQAKVTPWLENIDGRVTSTGLRIEVAKTSGDLVSWGRRLSICVGNGNYAKKARSGESTIIGLFQENQVLYTVETTMAGEILQIQTFNHRSGERRHRRAMEEVLTEYCSSYVREETRD